jgi:WD40 repeat protein/predicted Ser/Thr protein kinase
LGDYELMEELARGGMGVVFKARQLRLNRTVALKMIRDSDGATAESIRRFRAEAEAAAALQHPHIVPIYDVGEQEGQHFFTMEYVAGRSLAELVRDQPLTPREAARYVQTVAEAIHFAHEHNVLHRDLKPSNVLIDAFDQPRVTDFGLAKRLGGNPELTRTGQVLGTPQYLPPEQLSPETGAVGRPSDVYSLGAILYHLVTGRPPFLAATVEQTLLQVLDREPVSPRTLNPGVPRDLETICLKCLAKEPTGRYRTAEELAQELGRFLAGVPIRARPLNSFARVGRWARRKPALAASVAALLLSLGVGAGLTLWQWHRAQAHAERLSAALLQMRLEKVDALSAQNESAAAVTLLAQMLRQEPRNDVVRLRLSAALAQRPFYRSSVPPLRHRQIRLAWFSPDGHGLATTAEEDVRLWDARSGELLWQVPHPEPARPSFSPDGKLLATMASSHSVQVWDVARRAPIGPGLRHEQPLWASLFSANRATGPRDGPPWLPARELWIGHFIDESQFAVLTADGTLHLWDVRTAQRLRSAKMPHAEFSLDGQVFLTAEGARVDCWDAHSWTRIHAFAHDSPVQWARLSRTGGRLATLPKNGRLRVWDVRGGRLISDTIPVDGPLWSLTFSPEGDRVAINFRAGRVELFEVESGRSLASFPAAARPADEQSFSPDGAWLAIAERDAIHIWDTRTGQRVMEPLLHEGRVIVAAFGPHHESPSEKREQAPRTPHASRTAVTAEPARSVWSASGSPALSVRGFQASMDSQNSLPGRLAATTPGGSAHIWDLSRIRHTATRLAHADQVTSLEFRRDGAAVLTACKDGTARVWDVRSGAAITPWLKHDARIDQARFSTDGRTVATGSSDHTARIWDSHTGAPLTPPLRHGGIVRSLEFAPDAERLLSSSFDGTAVIWNARTGERLTTMSHTAKVPLARFDPDGERVITACLDGAARVWRLAGTNATVAVSVHHAIGVESAAFSPDGRRFATCGLDRTARVWEAATGRPISPPLYHSFDLTQARFSRDGRRLLTASQDGAARIWDVDSGVLLGKPMRHRDKVYDAVFSPDERFVLTTSEDDTVRIWDAATGYPVSDPFPQGATMAGARFSPDGRAIAVAAPGFTAQLWDTSFLHDSVPALWLADIAEAIVGRRRVTDEALEPVPWERLNELTARFRQEHPEQSLPDWLSRQLAVDNQELPGAAEPQPK